MPRERKGLRTPPLLEPDYAGKKAPAPTTRKPWDYTNGVSPLGTPKRLLRLREDLAKSGKLDRNPHKYKKVEEDSPAAMFLRERFKIPKDQADVFLSGSGSAGILKQILGLVDHDVNSYLITLGDTFPFIVSEAWIKRDEDKQEDKLHIAKVPGSYTSTNEELMETAVARMGVIRRRGPRIYYMCNPNTPKGDIASPEAVRKFVKAITEKGHYVVIDEAFGGWMKDGDSAIHLTKEFDNVVVTRSDVSKTWAMPDLRIGYGFASKNIGERIRRSLVPDPYYLSGPTQVYANHIFNPKYFDHKAYGKELQERTTEAKAYQVESILKEGLVTVVNRRELRSPFFLVTGPPHFYEELAVEGLIGGAGSGFKVKVTPDDEPLDTTDHILPSKTVYNMGTDGEIDDSSVRFTIEAKKAKIPVFTSRMNRAAERALRREEEDGR